MPALNDILQITAFARLFGQDVLNVFQYQVGTLSSGGNNLEAIAINWGVNFDTQIVTYFSQELAFTSIKVENLSDGIEIYEGSFDATGLQVGDTLPAHDTMSVKLTRQSRITRNGRKSFSGLPEGFVTNGALTYDPSFIEIIESFLSQPLELDTANDPNDPTILNPVIVGRTKDVNGVYQLDLNKINNVIGAVVSPFVSTQNTRKQ